MKCELILGYFMGITNIISGEESAGSKLQRVASPKDRVPLKHTGAGCKDLLSNANHADLNQKLTGKCTELDPKERAIKYGELNYYCDYRKRSKDSFRFLSPACSSNDETGFRFE